MDDIRGRIRGRIGERVRPAESRDETPSLDSARQRTIDGTVLLFDKERIFRADGPQGSAHFNKRQRPDKFKLAFAFSRIKVKDAEAVTAPWFTYEHEGMHGILVPLDASVRRAMEQHVVEKLSQAIKAKADAVVFPEFALPPVDLSDVFPDIRDFNPFDPDHQSLVDARFEKLAASMLEEACALAARDRFDAPFIFYGSMHCQRSRYNIGVVSPGHPFEESYVLAAERGNPITDETSIRSEKHTRSGPLVHKKRFPARRVGEAARVPGGLGFRLYPSKIGFIAVMICSDAIDLNQFWYIVRHNQRADAVAPYDRIGLVIVPSYTHSEMLHTTCKDLSVLAHTTVFVGNATGKLKTANPNFTTSMPSSAIYQCGEEEEDLSNDGVVVAKNERGICYYAFKPAPSKPG